MKNFTPADMAYVSWDFKPVLLEAYRGSDIVRWYGAIESQLKEMTKRYEAAKNYEYTRKLNTILDTWSRNVVTGSINRETLDVLLASVEVASADNWKCSNYFSNLRDSLRCLIATEEELPGVPPSSAPPRSGKTPGGPGGPPAEEFGPSKEAAPGAPGANPEGETAPLEPPPEEPK